MKVNQLIRPQRHHGVGPPLIIAELDLKDSLGEHLDQSAYLSSNQLLPGNVFQHGNDIQNL